MEIFKTTDSQVERKTKATHPLQLKENEKKKKRQNIRNKQSGHAPGRLVVLGLLELIGEPVKTLVETVTASGAGSLDVPGAVTQRVQLELLGDFRCVHGVGQILSNTEKGGHTMGVSPRPVQEIHTCSSQYHKHDKKVNRSMS